MVRRDDYRYFEGRAAQELEYAKSARDASAREIHRKFAKCYRDLARKVVRVDGEIPIIALPDQRLH